MNRTFCEIRIIFLGSGPFWWDPDHFCGIRIIFVGSGYAIFFFYGLASLLFNLNLFISILVMDWQKLYFIQINLKLNKSESWRIFYLNLKSKSRRIYCICLYSYTCALCVLIFLVAWDKSVTVGLLQASASIFYCKIDITAVQKCIYMHSGIAYVQLFFQWIFFAVLTGLLCSANT